MARRRLQRTRDASWRPQASWWVETRVGKHWSGHYGDVFTAGARANRPLPAVSGQESSSRPWATHALSSPD
jgi:hypothetical protein